MQTDSFIDAASSSESRCKDVCLGSRKKLLFLASQAQTKDVNRKYDTIPIRRNDISAIKNN